MKGIYPNIITAVVPRQEGMLLGIFCYLEVRGVYFEVRSRKFVKTMFHERYPTKNQILERFHEVIIPGLIRNLVPMDKFKDSQYTREQVEEKLRNRQLFKGEINES